MNADCDRDLEFSLFLINIHRKNAVVWLEICFALFECIFSATFVAHIPKPELEQSSFINEEYKYLFIFPNIIRWIGLYLANI